MITIKIFNEFMHSPVWTYDEDGFVTTDPLIIQKDEALQEMCNKAADMFAEYYEFNSHGESCWFNFEKERTEKEIMLNIIQQIISRLIEINDGSFVIEDLETERLKQL